MWLSTEKGDCGNGQVNTKGEIMANVGTNVVGIVTLSLELNSQVPGERRIQFSKPLCVLVLLDLVPSGDRLASNNKLLTFLQ
ncbi:hypothetical protein QYF36_012760 [Acer negundo]|nr:hypothetical protein QYF36_012760 [Acer negundo]